MPGKKRHSARPKRRPPLRKRPANAAALDHGKGAEAALRDSEQRLRAIVDTAVDAIITIDDKGTIESANAATERMFGYTQAELLGRNIRILMPEPHRGEHDGYLRRYFATGQATVIGNGRDVLGQRRDGTTVPIHLSVSEVQLRKGRMFTAIIHDFTQRRRLEAEVLKAASEEQRRIGQELHDGVCQNLVGAALGISMLASRLAVGAPAEAEEAERLANLVRQTADQARALSHGLAPLEIAADGLRFALEKLAAQASQMYQIHCEFYGNERIPAHDTAVATHLYRIAQEALNNAIRHGKATNVQVRLLADARESVLTIGDNGTGMPKNPGRGLGLQTMAYRARMIGGSLAIRPAPDRGMMVSCVIPSSCPKTSSKRKTARSGRSRAR